MDLSIIIPVYNVEQYIRRCLDSIYCQNIDEEQFEVIVVDDGTPDNSMVIVEEFALSHQNMTVIHQNNEGLSVARNTGLKNARGEYIWFVDSDDWLMNDAFSVLFPLMNDKKELIATILMYVYDSIPLNHKERNILSDIEVDSVKYLSDYSVGASQRYIIKRKLLIDKQLSFYPKILHEDGEFGPRLISNVKSVYIMAKPVYCYYQRQKGSIMSSWNLKNTNDLIFVSQRIFDYSKQIVEKKMKENLQGLSLRILMMAFPFQKMKTEISISKKYQESLPLIKKRALASLFLFSVPIRHRILFFLALIYPLTYLRIKNNK